MGSFQWTQEQVLPELGHWGDLTIRLPFGWSEAAMFSKSACRTSAGGPNLV